MDHELALRLFVSVVEENSFSKGGARLGIAQSTTSRMVTRLEEKLGARLLQRSTRKLTLTEAGKIYFERASRIAIELDEASEAIRTISAAPSGLLRVTAPASFARLFIAPAMSDFNEKYPDITVGLSLSDSLEDFIGLGYDVAIRLGDLSDSSLITRRLGSSRAMIIASPDYLARKGHPQSVDDLAKHNCLQFRSNPGQNTWRFVQGDAELSVQVSGSFYADNGDALMAAALSGLGIGYLPEWMLSPHLEDGSLVPVLPDISLKTALFPIHALTGYRQHAPAKQRAFIDFLHAHLANMPWIKG